jgi:hypothetical protein
MRRALPAPPICRIDGEVGPPALTPRRNLLQWTSHVGRTKITLHHGEADMGDKGSKDKSKREQQKKAQHTPKEKRQLKRDKKNKQTF